MAKYIKEKEVKLAKATLKEEQVSIYTLSNKDIRYRPMHSHTYIRGCKVTILVDSGSTLNFINNEIADELCLRGRKIEAFETTMANGRVELSDDFYKGINLGIQVVELKVDLHALPLATLDVVLRIQWLETLGKVVIDFGKGVMEFIHEGR